MVTQCLAIWQYHTLLEQLVHSGFNVVCKCINIENESHETSNAELELELRYILHTKCSVNRMISVKLCFTEPWKDFARCSST